MSVQCCVDVGVGENDEREAGASQWQILVQNASLPGSRASAMQKALCILPMQPSTFQPACCLPGNLDMQRKYMGLQLPHHHLYQLHGSKLILTACACCCTGSTTQSSYRAPPEHPQVCNDSRWEDRNKRRSCGVGQLCRVARARLCNTRALGRGDCGRQHRQERQSKLDDAERGGAPACARCYVAHFGSPCGGSPASAFVCVQLHAGEFMLMWSCA